MQKINENVVIKRTEDHLRMGRGGFGILLMQQKERMNENGRIAHHFNAHL